MKKIVITSLGLNEQAQAEVSGFKLSLNAFALTQANITENDIKPTNVELIGDVIYQDNIDVIEVVNPNTIKLSLTVRGDMPETGNWKLKEIGIFSNTGALFAHGFIDPPLEKARDYDTAVQVYITYSRAGETININATQHSAIATVSGIRLLPKPIDFVQNVVSVLNAQLQPDHTFTPALAIKYGPGGEMWGFTGHDRVYYGKVQDSILEYDNQGHLLGTKSLKLDPFEKGFYVKPGDVLLVQAVVGPGYGQTRKMRFEGDGTFLEIENSYFIGVDKNTTFAFWKNMSQEVNAVGALLKPVFSNYKIYSDGVNKDYTLSITPTSIDYVWVFVNGANNCDFSINGRLLTLDRIYPKDYLIDVTVLRMVPDSQNTGTVLTLNQYKFMGNGEDRKFKINKVPSDVNNVFLYIGSVFQERGATYKLIDNEVTLNVPPERNCEITIDVYTEIAMPNSSVRMVVHRVIPASRNIVLYSGSQTLGQITVFISGVHQRDTAFSTSAYSVVLNEDPRPNEVYMIYELRQEAQFLNLQRPLTDIQLVGKQIRFTRQDGTSGYVDLSSLLVVQNNSMEARIIEGGEFSDGIWLINRGDVATIQFINLNGITSISVTKINGPAYPLFEGVYLVTGKENSDPKSVQVPAGNDKVGNFVYRALATSGTNVVKDYTFTVKVI